MKKGLVLAGQLSLVGGAGWLTWNYVLRDFLFHKHDVQVQVEKRARAALMPHRVDRGVVHEAALILTNCVETKTAAGIHGDWKVSREHIASALRQAFPRMTSSFVDFHSMGFVADENGSVAPEDFVIGIVLVDEGSLTLFSERVHRIYQHLTSNGSKRLDSVALEPALDCVVRMQLREGTVPVASEFVAKCSRKKGEAFLTMEEFINCSETARWFKQ